MADQFYDILRIAIVLRLLENYGYRAHAQDTVTRGNTILANISAVQGYTYNLLNLGDTGRPPSFF